MRLNGVFKGWVTGKPFGFIAPEDGSSDVFLHMSAVATPTELPVGAHVSFHVQAGLKGRRASDVQLGPAGLDHPGGSVAPTTRRRASASAAPTSPSPRPTLDPPEVEHDQRLISEDIEELDTTTVASHLLEELSRWKREAKAEDNDRYFWHVSEADEIAKGDKYFVIGRKGSGKTAICEYFNRQTSFDLFAEKLSFKNFPFNELYSH